MSLTDLNLSLKVTTASAAKATEAITATVAATRELGSSKTSFEAQQQALIDSVLGTSVANGGISSDKKTPALIDLAALMRQLLDIIKVINDPKTSGFQRVNERQAAQYLIDLMKRFGGADIRKIDFNSLLNPDVKAGARKTSVSKSSSGTSTLSISTAVAQGKMGW